MWEELGKLQFDFLKAHGLRPEHTLLDIGCGCLRGGLHFIRYLEPGHYSGLDISGPILAAGRQYLTEEGLDEKCPNLLLTDGFRFDELEGSRFDFVLAFGVFVETPASAIRECFLNLHKLLTPNGVFFATFWLAQRQSADPLHLYFRYPMSFFEELAQKTGHSVEFVKDFNHPRGHQMLAIRPFSRTISDR